MDDIYCRKLSVAISEEQHAVLEQFPHGLIAPVFRKLIEQIGEMLEVAGPYALVAILQGQVRIEDIARRTQKGE